MTILLVWKPSLSLQSIAKIAKDQRKKLLLVGGN